jgi:hypothetical protein
MPVRRNVEISELGPAPARWPSSKFALSAAEKNSLKIETGWMSKKPI